MKQQVYYITITVLDIIHPPVFNLNPDVSDTGFRLRLHVEYALVVPDQLFSVGST
jgi:hypothetical protein